MTAGKLRQLSQADMNNFEEFLFYDIEVFNYDTFFVFKNIDGVPVERFHNDTGFEGIRELVEGKVLVGYNNYHYDDYILSAVMQGKGQEEVKQINDDIIGGHKPIQKVDDRILSLDCFQQINVAKSSLKKIEANIGMDIEETQVDFDIGRKLTAEERERTWKYCSHDVDATINIFKLRWYSYFVPKLQVTAMLPETKNGKKLNWRNAYRWNTTTITSNILVPMGAVLPDSWSTIHLGNPANVVGCAMATEKLLDSVPTTVKDMWVNETGKKLKVESYGCSIEFGLGGLHGVNLNNKRASNVKLLDVTSLYPNIILHMRGLDDSTDIYRDIVDQRVKIKHSDPVRSNALKLVINSTYGLMKNEYSKIYRPKAALSVCIYGQTVLYDLCRRLYEAGYHLLNINTDGVAFFGNPTGAKTFEDVQAEWEDEYGFELELSEFDEWIQKDVNNYIARKGDYVKVKGGMVNHYYDPIDYMTNPLDLNAGFNWTGTNSLGIIHLCIVNKLMFDKGINETIRENMDKPILFQQVLQAGRTYKGVFDEDGNEYNNVNRVFAAKKGTRLYKHKVMDNGQLSKQLFPNAPENMFIFNGDLSDFKDFKQVVDFDWYVNLAHEKLKMWMD